MTFRGDKRFHQAKAIADEALIQIGLQAFSDT